MKLIKLSFIIAVAVMAIVGIGTTSYAFHDGGVAGCESCHTMHNSLQGAAMNVNGLAGMANMNEFLLKGSDQSSTCLNCHESSSAGSYHVSTPVANFANAAPINFGPGGDFAWLKTGATGTTADRRGHNIVAADFNYNADGLQTTAPGGTFLASQLNCISCHNPHNGYRRIDEAGTVVKPSVGANVHGITASGSYSNAPVASATAPLGTYRFLRGSGIDQQAKSYPVNFSANAPDALTTNTYNRDESTVDTHTAYGAGMSQWCANCHTTFYDTAGDSGVGNSSHPHPVNVSLSIGNEMTNYNAYVGSGNLTGGARGGYWSLVPVEMGTSDYATLKAAASSSGGGTYLTVDATAKVMCLSCHRAHASGFQSMTRFNVGGFTTNLTTGQYEISTGLTTTAQMTVAYYNRPSTKFDSGTRQLCNKCHAKD